MPDIEAKLNITAEYKQALAAIAMLGKALDAVQERAKVALSVANGAQGGGQDSGGAGKAAAEQKAAVEALSAAMKDAAAAAAAMAEGIGKLTPALEAMGPNAEQVQQVLTLAGHYKELATAMGVAADAAAKYNASNVQQGETDERIQKLMEENQQLMELVSNIRAEYAEIVKRNAELNRTNTAREEGSRTGREELEVEEDLSYQMQLAAMSKRELVAEIDRLTKARKEAAQAGDEAKYKELTEELKLARQALTKLRQEQQLSKIAWLQQAQAAQQMGQNVRTLVDGFANFGDAVENGTVNLTGMVTAVTSLSLAIKAGLGPLGWALAAVELLTSAWNWYAKSQKEAEEAEKKRQERIVSLTTAYHEAAAEAQKFKDQEARKAEINALVERYEDLNRLLRERNSLLESALRMKQAEIMMEAKEAEQALSVEKHEIMRSYYRGEIDEEEMQSRLDLLNIKRAQNKKEQVEEKGEAEISTAQEKIKVAENKNAEAHIGVGELAATDERLYSLDPAEMKKRADAYDLAYTNAIDKMHAIEAKERELAEYKNSFATGVLRTDITGAGEEAYQKQVKEKEAEIARMKQLAKELEEEAKRRKAELGKWTTDYIYSGEYAERYKDHKDKYKKAQEEIQKAEEEVIKAKADLAALERQHALNIRQEEQNIRFAIQDAGQNVQTRAAKKEFDERKRQEREAEQRRKKLEREAERRAKLQEKALREGEYEGNLTKEARAIARGKGYEMLADNKLSQAEIKALIAAAQKNTENEAFISLVKDILQTALNNKNVTVQALGKFRQQLSKININNLD